METSSAESIARKRQLLLRDSITFLSLTAITVVLFLVTLFLFHSFQQHRSELAQRWSGRGLAALQAGQPEQAIISYRTALAYAPGKRSYELMLAEALAQAGKTDESYNYFVGLREERAGDGFINWQLARLSVKKKDVERAINFYRSSIYGNWEGDGVTRRREVRLELAQYLIQQRQFEQAKAELMIAGGNAPDTPELDITLAGLLEQAGASSEASDYYKKALVHQPHNQVALSGASRLAYNRGDYTAALALLERAIHDRPGDEESAALLVRTRRIMQLMPSETLPARERVERILAARAIAKKRWDMCVQQGDAEDASLQSLRERWSSEDAKTDRSTLLRDSDRKKAALQLAYDTEVETSQHCGAPTGDDALLLLLAQSAVREGGSH